MSSTIARINRAVADCLILCAYSQKPPHDAAEDFFDGLSRDSTWKAEDVQAVNRLVLGVLERLNRSNGDSRGLIK